MKQTLQIALLGIFSICALPTALHAQNRADRNVYQRHERYEERNRYYTPYNAYQGGYQDRGYQDPCNDGRHASLDRSVAIVGGSAAAGAFIGAAAGHGQGAAIGAIAGGITGLIIDQATRDHRYYNRY